MPGNIKFVPSCRTQMICLFQRYVYKQSLISCVCEAWKKTVNKNFKKLFNPATSAHGWPGFADTRQTTQWQWNNTAQEFSWVFPQFADNPKFVPCFVLRPADAVIEDVEICLVASAGCIIGWPVHALLGIPRWDGPCCPPMATKIQDDKVAEGRPCQWYVVVLSLCPQWKFTCTISLTPISMFFLLHLHHHNNTSNRQQHINLMCHNKQPNNQKQNKKHIPSVWLVMIRAFAVMVVR